MNITRGNEITVNVSHSSCFLDHLLSNDKNMHYKARGFIVITTIIITKLRSFHNSFVGTSLTLLIFLHRIVTDCTSVNKNLTLIKTEASKDYSPSSFELFMDYITSHKRPNRGLANYSCTVYKAWQVT